MAVVGTPGYFAGRGKRETPQDLSGHTCLNLRLSTLGGIYAWEFEKDGRELRVRVDGRRPTFNNARMIVDACLDGFGLNKITRPSGLMSQKFFDRLKTNLNKITQPSGPDGVATMQQSSMDCRVHS
jgi:DNA-binding transcriptional LysR family regulator